MRLDLLRWLRTPVGTAIVYSGTMSFVLLKAIALVMPLRAAAGDEAEGLDVTMHGEEAYLQAGGMDAIPAPARPEKHGAVIKAPVEA